MMDAVWAVTMFGGHSKRGIRGGGGSDQEGRRRTAAATAHSGDARPKPGWGPGMERGSGFKALREGRSHVNTSGCSKARE